jgi:bacteriocin-type transport-associated protein
MTEILTRELNNDDIDWMLSVGQHTSIEPDTVLVHPNQSQSAIYIILSGVLTVTLPRVIQDGTRVEAEIAQLTNGQIVGSVLPVEQDWSAATITALTPCELFAIERSPLLQKIQDDIGFAARLYRANALMLADQLKHLVFRLTDGPTALSQMQLREAVTVFAELQDSDLDWLIAVGQVQNLPANTVLVQSGRSTDALHIVLEGAIALSALEDEFTLLTRTFSRGDTPAAEQEFARLSRGDLFGETLFVDAYFSEITVRTLRDTQILSIPRWRLTAKLLHDLGFASRFYRVMAMLLGNKYQNMIQQLHQECSTANGEQTPGNVHVNELNHQLLNRVALAEARFDWLLKRATHSSGTGEG